MREIEDIIDEDEDDEHRGVEGDEVVGYQPPYSVRSSTFIGQALQGRKLEELSVVELTQILSDIEVLVRELSEELVTDLGLRDELEFEKELKNNFISLLLSIQSKRRQQNVDGGSSSGATRRKKGEREMKYLTTVIVALMHVFCSQMSNFIVLMIFFLHQVIPYNAERGCPPLSTLQVILAMIGFCFRMLVDVFQCFVVLGAGEDSEKHKRGQPCRAGLTHRLHPQDPLPHIALHSLFATGQTDEQTIKNLSTAASLCFSHSNPPL